MKTNEKNISLKEALQLNHRAYKLFYRYYPKLILSQISLTIWKALTPYIIIYIYLHLLLKNLQATEALTAFVFW